MDHMFAPMMVKELGKFEEDNIEHIRKKMDEYFVNNKSFKEWEDQCDVEEIKIPGGDGQDMVVYIIKAKKNKDKKDLPCMIECHGGWGISMQAKYLNGVMSRLCTMMDVVIFNIEYRLAPEHKTPAGAQDCVAAVKHFKEHAAQYGGNPDKLSLMGDSGGAWIAMIACVLLMREDPALPKQLIKTLYLMYPQLGLRICELPRNTIPEYDHFRAEMQEDVFRLLASDYDKQVEEEDLLLTPVKISVEEAKNLPGVVLTTSEFDHCKYDVHYLLPTL